MTNKFKLLLSIMTVLFVGILFANISSESIAQDDQEMPDDGERGQKPPPPHKNPNKFAKKLIKIGDEDGDGCLNEEELTNALKKIHKKRKGDRDDKKGRRPGGNRRGGGGGNQ